MESSAEVDKFNKRSFRPSQAILAMASVLDKQTYKNKKSTRLADVQHALQDERGDR